MTSAQSAVIPAPAVQNMPLPLKKAVVLYLHPGPAPIQSTPSLNMLHHLGNRLTGAAIYGAWAHGWDDAQRWRDQIEPACGGFAYQPVPYQRFRPAVVRSLLGILMMYRASVREARALPRPVEVVVGYSPYGIGFAAWLVAKRLGVPLVIQVQNDLRNAFLAQPGRFQSIRRGISQSLSRFVLSKAAAWQLYYPGQSGRLQPRNDQKIFYLADFTPVSAVPEARTVTREFLMVGYPFSVKGVDVAIRAFRSAGTALEEWSLRIIGHCEDLSPYIALAGGDPRIRFDGPTLHVTALQAISECGVFVLASRTEAIARVVVEAMAARRPIIATDVGGIGTLIENEETGLLIPPEDEISLKAAMVRLAGDERLRDQLGAAARLAVDSMHTESAWTERFTHMIHALRETPR